MNQKIFNYFHSQIGNEISNSPAATWLGGIIREVSESRFVVEYTVAKNMCNPAQILHGGVSSLMMDDVIGMGNIVASQEYIMSSVNLNVDFLSSARVGEVLKVEANLIRSGENLNHWEAVITKESGKIIAKASSNMLKTHVKLSDIGF